MSHQSCSYYPSLTILSLMSCQSYPVPCSCPSCPVIAIMFWPFSSLSCPAGVIRLTRQADLSRMTSTSWPVHPVLSRLSCTGCRVLADLSWLSCHGCPSRLSCIIVMSQLSCPVIFLLSFHLFPVLAVLSFLSSQLYYPSALS
jgi:hypothetical protein